MHGEKWVSYPLSLKFPWRFSSTYPFRGRGIVSRLLFVANRFCIDRLFLHRETSPLPFENVAWFWPSPGRSTKRFYGYRVAAGHVVTYIKVASGDEMARLAKEVENVKKICSRSPKSFKVPQCLSIHTIKEFLVAEFEPLPEGAIDIPDSPEVMDKVRAAREEIVSFGYAHGDYLSHNIKIANGMLWIIDWEEMKDAATALLDEISFNTAFLHFHRGKSIRHVCKWFISAYLSDSKMRDDALAALHSMAERKVGLGGKLLECLEGDMTNGTI